VLLPTLSVTTEFATVVYAKVSIPLAVLMMIPIIFSLTAIADLHANYTPPPPLLSLANKRLPPHSTKVAQLLTLTALIPPTQLLAPQLIQIPANIPMDLAPEKAPLPPQTATTMSEEILVILFSPSTTEANPHATRVVQILLVVEPLALKVVPIPSSVKRDFTAILTPSPVSLVLEAVPHVTPPLNALGISFAQLNHPPPHQRNVWHPSPNL
jgi:hypothetical protein